MDTSELIDIIQNRKIAVYGAGYAAVSFYNALQIRHLDDQVVCFLVTDPNNAHGEMYGKPVKVIDDVISMENLYVCVAVHETLKNEIDNYLLKYGISSYAWIYPNIYEIAFGTPIKKHVKIKIKEIMKQFGQDEYYMMAVRYLAIENYYGKNDIGYNIYIKAMGTQCEVITARKRLDRFIKVIENWDKNGYREENDILIDDKKRYIDGMHRLTLAWYHNLDEVYCNIFPYTNEYGKMIEHHPLNLESSKEIFLPHELDAIEKVQKKLYEIG